MGAPVYPAHFCGLSASVTTRKVKKDEVEAEVREELENKIYKDTRGFSNLFQQFHENIAIPVGDILKELAHEGLWNADSEEWTDLPASPKAEDTMYEPFVRIANFIAHKSKALDGKRNELDISWHYYPHRTPDAIDEEAVDFKPDVGATCNISPGRPVDPHRHPRYPSETPMHSWAALIIPGEFKGAGQFRLATQGICNYFSHIYRETMNRRAIFGFCLCGKKLTVWLSDRTGVIGSHTVDIHDYPDALISFIAAISVLPPHRLGIDTHIRRYQPVDMDPGAPTLDVNNSNPEGAGYVPEGGLWEVDIDEEVFILWRGISLRRGEIMVGRGTRVFHAWLKEEFLTKPVAERRRFIVKDTWKDDRRKDEDFFYKKLQVCDGEMVPCDGVARYYKSCVPQEGGEDDTTTKAIRRNLKAAGKPYSLVPRTASTRERNDVLLPPSSPSGKDPDMMTVYSVANRARAAPTVHPSDTDVPDPVVRGRTHEWVVLVDSYGWQLQCAISPKELALALRDAIAGHKRCWDCDILHRDISTGNVLINYNTVENNRGFLIDFDNAKDMLDEDCLSDDPLSFTLPFASYEVLKKDYYFAVPGKTDQSDTSSPGNHVVHDLESFLWCLVYCCLMREGPNTRRHALRVTDPIPGSQLDATRTHLTSIFEGPGSTMVEKKFMFIQNEGLFKRQVLDYFAPFWVTLVPLCREFYGLIRTAYTTRDFTGLHSEVLSVFDRHLPGLPDIAEDPCYRILQEAEQERRKRDLTEVWRSPPREKASHNAKKRSSQQKDAGDGGDKEDRADAKRVRRGFPEEW